MTIIIDKEISSGGYVDIGARATKSSQSIGTIGSYVAVTRDSESYDTNGFHDNTTNNSRFTIPVDKGGKYIVITNIMTDNGYAGDQVRIIVNNSTVIAYHHNQMSHKGVSLSAEYNFSAGDYIEVQFNAGQNYCNILNTSNYTIRKMS